MPRWFDFCILGYLATLAPLMVLLGYRAMIRRLDAGDTEARARAYRQTIVAEWFALTALLAIWFIAGRDLATLGLEIVPGWRFAVGTALAVAASAVQLAQSATFPSRPEAAEKVARSISHLEVMIPHSRGELRIFRALSVTAGVCEEVIYRGYAMWVLTELAGVWVAIAASTVLFVLAHLYQGARSVPGISLVGLVMAGLYVLTGSLVGPIILHAAIDVTSGQMGYEALRGRNPEREREHLRPKP